MLNEFTRMEMLVGEDGIRCLKFGENCCIWAGRCGLLCG